MSSGDACAADLIFAGGRVVTVDADDSVAEAVAIRGNRIVAVGRSVDVMRLRGPDTRVVELKGRALLPGLIDSHTHPLHAAWNLLRLDCRDPKIRGIPDLKKAVARWAKKMGPGRWVRGVSYNDSKLAERRQVTRWELDEAAPENPVYLSSDTGHQAVVNSLALRLAGVTRDTPDPEGGAIERDASGEPTGLLYETAQRYFYEKMPSDTLDELKPALRWVLQQYTEWGVTSTQDASATAAGIHCYQRLLAEGFRQVRVGLMVRLESPDASLAALEALGIESGMGDDWLRFMSLKIMGDGSGAGGTSCVYEPQNRGPKGLGLWTTSPEDQERLVAKAHSLGIRVSIHAIGDRGVDAALDAIEKAQKTHPVKDMRHRTEHNSLCTLKQLKRIKKLGVTPSSSVGYMFQLGDQYSDNYGSKRSRWLHPHRTMREMGIVAGGNSDAPVAYYSPFVQMYAAVTRKTSSGRVVGPEEAISVIDAIRVYTLNGAYLSKEEAIKGSIESGKLADLVVVDRDITQLPPEALLDARVDITVVDGRIIYQRDK